MMRRMSAVLFSMIVVAGARADAGPDEEVAAATRAWTEAYNSRDVERIAKLYDEEALFWGTSATKVASEPAAVRAYYKSLAGRPDAKVELLDRTVRVFGQVATSAGTVRFSDVRDGKPTTTMARFSFTFRQSGGRWVIIEHHSSRMPGA